MSLVARNAKLNKFNLSHDHKTTLDMGYLVPVGCIPTLPGDWFKMSSEFLIRFMPTVSPVMHRFKATLRAYYVPYRLLMEQGKWYEFLTGGQKEGENHSLPGDSIVLPYVSAPEGGFAVGSLADHLGIPTGVAGINVSAFPFRAYALIYNEWYKNQSIQDDIALSLADGADGADATTNTDLLRRCWHRDYFTDCLPSPQKGPSVLMPMGTSAPVIGNGTSLGLDDGHDHTINMWYGTINGTSYNLGVDGSHPTGGYNVDGLTEGINRTLGVSTDPGKSGLIADLANASAPTINQLRLAATVQQFQELNCIGGSRPVEWVYNHYGVRVPDATLQRPLLLGGFSTSIVISEVLQTGASTNSSPQGNMAGHGVGAGMSPNISFHCTEHGLILLLMSVMPETGYFQGIPREYSKTTRYEFGIPLLAHIGEQGVKVKELYATGVADTDNAVFGYQPNYQEYRQLPSQCTGQMRTTLAYWHEDRKFNSTPQLNSEFVTCTPDTRIWAVEDQANADHLIVQMVHHIMALRPLPKYGTPGIHVL